MTKQFVTKYGETVILPGSADPNDLEFAQWRGRIEKFLSTAPASITNLVHDGLVYQIDISLYGANNILLFGYDRMTILHWTGEISFVLLPGREIAVAIPSDRTAASLFRAAIDYDLDKVERILKRLNR